MNRSLTLVVLAMVLIGHSAPVGADAAGAGPAGGPGGASTSPQPTAAPTGENELCEYKPPRAASAPSKPTPKAPGGKATAPSPLEVIDVTGDPVKLVARLQNPPRTRLIVSIDNDSGGHVELSWAPGTSDGLQQSVILANGTWRVTGAIEDEVVQAGQTLLVTSLSLASVSTAADKQIRLEASRTTVFASATTSEPKHGGPTALGDQGPSVTLRCVKSEVPMDSLTLDARRAAAASTARGLLDQTVPAPVSEALTLLGEIAVARAKSGAMDLVREKFVKPMCDELTLAKIRLGGDERAFPRTCALLENMRLEDVLSSGRSLVDAARDDLRFTIAPQLVDRIPGVGPGTKALAKIGLTFANRVIEGESSQVAELDLLVALLDRSFLADGLVARTDVIQHLLSKADPPLLPAEVVLRAIELALPTTFDDDSFGPQPWHGVKDSEGRLVCVRSHPKSDTYRPADRAACVKALAQVLATSTWLDDGAGKLEPADWRRSVLAAVVERLKPDQFRKAIIALRDSPVLLDALPREARDAYCAGRVVISIAKWCSSRDRCSAGDIGSIIDRPWTVFSRNSNGDSLDAICWEKWKSTSEPTVGPGENYFAPFGHSAEYTELATTLVSFLQPVPAGQERARTIAMVRWLFRFIGMQSLDESQKESLHAFQEVAERLIDGDYARALSQGVALAERLMCPPGRIPKCKAPAFLRRSTELLGAVASYARTYQDTKSLDPAEARKARRKALEALIDAATDRRDRDGAFIVSLGSNVGMGGVATMRRDEDGDLSGFDPAFGVRIPLGLSAQWLPEGKEALAGNCRRKYIGWHLGVTLADLGQFLAADDSGVLDDVRWGTVIAPGAEVGMLVGTPTQLLTFNLSANYAPALFETGETPDTKRQGAVRFGLTVGYYVPFFDLN